MDSRGCRNSESAAGAPCGRRHAAHVWTVPPKSRGTSRRTLVLPLFFFSPSVKLMADEGLAKWPEAFLTTLQEAMASPATQPLTNDDRSLMQRFDTSFA